MPARHFTSASSDLIRTGLGALGFAFGPGTCAAIVNPASVITQVIFAAGTSITAAYRLQLTNSGQVRLLINAGNTHSTTTYGANKWWLLAGSKANGNVAGRFHLYDYAADAWTHEAGVTTVANGTVPATRGNIGVAQDESTAPFNGDIAVAAVWNVVLSDSQIEALAYDLLSWHAPSQPKALWVLDQDAISQGIVDRSGNGADQSSITGTSLGTSSVPVLSRGAEIIAA